VFAAVLVAAGLVGIVDLVDEGWAVVEWDGRAFGFVPADLLPRGVGEGDRVVLRPRRRGQTFELPWEVAPDLGPVVASLHPKRGPWRPLGDRDERRRNAEP